MNIAFQANSIQAFPGDTFILESDRDQPQFLYLKRRLRISFTFLDFDKLIVGLSLLKKCIEGAIENY